MPDDFFTDDPPIERVRPRRDDEPIERVPMRRPPVEPPIERVRPTRPPNFNAAGARADRDSAMADVERAADPDWKLAAIAAVEAVAREREFFTTDPVVERLEAEGIHTREMRAMGPIMLTAARGGICQKSNLLPVPSIRRSLHASPITVWQSLIYGGDR